MSIDLAEIAAPQHTAIVTQELQGRRRRTQRRPRRSGTGGPEAGAAGSPADYADAIIDNTLSRSATVTTASDLIAAWT